MRDDRVVLVLCHVVCDMSEKKRRKRMCVLLLLSARVVHDDDDMKADQVSLPLDFLSPFFSVPDGFFFLVVSFRLNPIALLSPPIFFLTPGLMT